MARANAATYGSAASMSAPENSFESLAPREEEEEEDSDGAADEPEPKPAPPVKGSKHDILARVRAHREQGVVAPASSMQLDPDDRVAMVQAASFGGGAPMSVAARKKALKAAKKKARKAEKKAKKPAAPKRKAPAADSSSDDDSDDDALLAAHSAGPKKRGRR